MASHDNKRSPVVLNYLTALLLALSFGGVVLCVIRKQEFVDEKASIATEANLEPRFHGRTLAEWLELAKAENVAQRAAAVEALASFEPLAPESLAVLQQAMKDPEPEVRVSAIRAWSAFSVLQQGRQAMRDLSVEPLTVGDSSDTTNGTAVKAESGIASATLVDLLTDERPVVRRAALAALSQQAGTSSEVLPQLLPLLAEQDPSIRQGVFAILSNLGPDASLATDNLIQILKNQDDGETRPLDERIATRNILKNIGSPAAQKLIESVETNDDKTAFVAEALPLIARIIRVARREESSTSAEDWKTQGMSLLARHLTDKRPEIQIAALDGIRVLGRDGPPFVSAIIDGMRGGSRQYRLRAAEVLVEFEADPAVALPAILDACYADPAERSQYREIVERVGMPATPWLTPALSDLDPEVRRWAREVLQRITGVYSKQTLTAITGGTE